MYAKHFLILVSLIALLAACNDMADAATPETYTAAVSSKDTTVAGQDSDNNGIRDDVQSDLKALYSGEEYEMALNSAREFQTFLVYAGGDIKDEPTDIQQLNNYITNFFSENECIINKYGPNTMDRIADDVVDLTINNDLRAKAYTKANNLLSGSMFSSDTIYCGSKL